MPQKSCDNSLARSTARKAAPAVTVNALRMNHSQSQSAAFDPADSAPIGLRCGQYQGIDIEKGPSSWKLRTRKGSVDVKPSNRSGIRARGSSPRGHFCASSIFARPAAPGLGRARGPGPGAAAPGKRRPGGPGLPGPERDHNTRLLYYDMSL